MENKNETTPKKHIRTEGTGEKTERPKKKASISAVYNAQYSKEGRKDRPRRDGSKAPAGRSQGQTSSGSRPRHDGQGGQPRRKEGTAKPNGIIRPRPVGERAMRPISERTPDPVEEKKITAAENAASEKNAAAAEKEAAANVPEAKQPEAVTPAAETVTAAKEETHKKEAEPELPQIKVQSNIFKNADGTPRVYETPRRSSDRKAGEGENRGRNDRRNSSESGRNSDRSRNGDRTRNGENRGGDNRNRSGEGRNYRSQDGRNQEGRNGENRSGENRNGDSRNRSGEGRNYRNQDGRNQESRNGEGRSYGGNNRGGFKNGDGRNNQSRPGQGAAASSEDMRGKETRDRGNNRTAGKKNQEHDKLGKRQENYINLEKHGGKKKQMPAAVRPKEDEDTIKTIVIPEKLTVRDLADAMKLQPSVIVKELFMKGQMVTVNHEIDFAQAEEIALEHNIICEQEEKVDVIAELLKEEEEAEEGMITRPPVVCVMGHVDHGKTSLLDKIRSTRVTAREAGGITQHIGASVVSINGQNITFLDTPGHEAFTAMRMRGANSTDIAILVIAADDGVMPQTIEAINHAKAAGVEIIVAVNKIDKPAANIERVKQELTEYGLVAEDWGGSTIFCPVSAKTGEGIDNLLEMILLTADVLELKANPERNARGLVIEAQLDKGRGSVATVLVQKGTLHVGDAVACGSSYGKVRAMIDDKGRRVKTAGPSTPVEILGLNNVPAAGETFVMCDSEKEAKSFADTYVAEEKKRLLEETKSRMSLDDLFSQIQSGNMKELNLIVKADVQGSVEAVSASLIKLSNEEVAVKVIHSGVGAINESDVILASASNAIIIGFNVRPDPMAKQTAEHENVDVRLYRVIYNAIEDVEKAMKGMLDPIFEEKVLGHAEVRQLFKASGVGTIAGSYVMDGTIERGCKVRVSREGQQIFEGELASLKRFKDDVKEVRTGFECGLVVEGFNDLQEFDMVEAYKMVEVPR